MFVAILAAMAVAVSAQTADPCEGLNDAYKEWSEVQFPKKDIPGLKQAVETGKVFVEKFGGCPAKEAFKDSKEFVDFVVAQIPIKEKRIKTLEFNARKSELTNRVISNLDKNWDEVYAAGRELLKPEFGDEFACDVRIILAFAGQEEFQKKKVNKYSDDAIKYSKEALAYFDSGKTCKAYGYQKWGARSKEEAIGWLNYNIGFLYAFDKGNLREGANYMYKVSQLSVDAAKDAAVYGALSKYYIPLLNAEVKKLQELPVPADTEPEDTGKPKADAIKAQTAVIRGLAERIMETLGQTYARIDDTPGQKAVKDGVLNQFKEVYGTRFNTKDTGPAAAMIKTYGARPVANPSSPIAPIAEEPATATTTPATTAPTTKPATTPAMKPAVTPTAKPVTPAAKPVSGPAAKPTGTTGTKPGVAKVKKAGTR